MAHTQRHIAFGLFCLALGLLAYQPIRRVVTLSLHGGTDSSHIVLIPFITGALLFSRRAVILKSVKTAIVAAVPLLALGGAIYFASHPYVQSPDETDRLALTTVGVIILWLAGFLAFYGAEAFRAGLFPLLFLFLAVPIPSVIFHETARFLQRGSAEMVSILFAVTGTPAYRNDYDFMLPGLTIEVAEECSGIRSTLGICIVTLLASNLLLKSNWKRLALILAAIPISLFKNAVRIATLSLLAIHWDMGFITGRLHSEGGIVFMMIGLVLLYPFLALLIRSEAKHFASGVRP